jgi:hypothetical protein
MHRRSPHQISISWEVTTLEVAAGGFLSFDCQECQTTLDIHQPDEEHPSQLLGTCRSCGAWHLVEIASDGSEAMLLKVPNLDDVRHKLTGPTKSTRPNRRAQGKPQSFVQLGNGAPLS